MNDKVLTTKLRDCTLNLLINRPKPMTLQKIADETPLSVEWLKAFQTGKINDPSAGKIETLYEFLSGKCLIV